MTTRLVLSSGLILLGRPAATLALQLMGHKGMDRDRQPRFLCSLCFPILSSSTVRHCRKKEKNNQDILGSREQIPTRTTC